MMTKNKSKQIKQVKYLLLVPVLASMLLYTSCSENEKSFNTPKLEKRKIYLGLDKKPLTPKGGKLSYMDVLISTEVPQTREYSLEELSKEEREEYQELLSKGTKNKMFSFEKVRFFEGKEGRKLIYEDLAQMLEKHKKENKSGGKSSIGYKEDIPFAILDKHPTFPGCDEGDKDCFNQKVMKFVVDNFDSKIANKLSLEKETQRIYVQFKIGKDGVVSGINARAPHPALKDHSEEIVSKLPKMLPGEKDGKVVSTRYTLPITFKVN